MGETAQADGMPSSRGRVVVARATGGLALGDAALILAFVAAGELRHYPVDLAIARIPGTLVPFLLGWAIAATLLGLYGGSATQSGPRVAVRTAVGWLAGTGVALALRATPFFHGTADPTFALVAAATGIVLLVPWRVAASVRNLGPT